MESTAAEAEDTSVEIVGTGVVGGGCRGQEFSPNPSNPNMDRYRSAVTMTIAIELYWDDNRIVGKDRVDCKSCNKYNKH